MTPDTAGSDKILAELLTLHPKLMDLNLSRVWRLLEALGNPHRDVPQVIHAAGTNGKGSTLAMIRAGLEATGAQVHVYTSPHLARFHERIRLAGDLIAEDHLAAILDECRRANGGEQITYFEITTVAALLAFSRVAADYTLLETGLGGRLDATNVFERPRLTVITPVDLDHQQFLGDTIDLIAGEKAGIIKKGVTCVVAPQKNAALEVIENRAAALGAPLVASGQHWHVTTERERLVFQDEAGLLDLPLPALRGPHQIVNAGTALAALRALGVDDDACAAAITGAVWPARMQKLITGPLTRAAPQAELILDGGHNPAAGAVIAETLGNMAPRPTVLICGMLNTKDVEGYMRPLAGVADRLIAVSIPGEQATLTAEQTAEHARGVGLTAHVAPDVASAVTRIAAEEPRARILICGSLYLAGAVLRENA